MNNEDYLRINNQWRQCFSCWEISKDINICKFSICSKCITVYERRIASGEPPLWRRLQEAEIEVKAMLAEHNPAHRISERQPVEKVDESKSKKTDESSENKLDDGLCKICFEGKKDIGFLHEDMTMHYACCSKCADKVDKCPICRRAIINKIKVFDN